MAAFVATEQPFLTLCERGETQEAALLYTTNLQEPVHAFFDKVYINVDDPAVRSNRLLLLHRVNRLFVDHIADLSLVVGS